MADRVKTGTSVAIAVIALVVAVAAILANLLRLGTAHDTAYALPNRVPDTLRAAIVPAPPITFFDPTTKVPRGYAVDLINAVSRDSKIAVEFIPSDWATMGAALASNKADVVVGPIFLTDGRAREFSFTDPLWAFAVVPVTLKGNTKITSIESLKTPGLRMAVGRGGFDAEFVSRSMPNAKVSFFPPDDPNLAMLEVLAGRADVAFVDYGTAAKFVKEHPEAEIRFEDTPVSVQYAGFMLRSRDDALRNFFNIALRNLDLTGELAFIDSSYAAQRFWYGRVSQRPTIVR